MSSYHQNMQQSDKGQLALSGKEPLPCPDCGKVSLIRVKNDCTLLDGTVVPNLERLQCSSCKANFFDVPAMDAISAHRRKISRKDTDMQSRKKQDTKIA